MNYALCYGDSLEMTFHLYQPDGVTPLDLSNILFAEFFLESDYHKPILYFVLPNNDINANPIHKVLPLTEGKIKVNISPDSLYPKIIIPTKLRYRMKVETVGLVKVIKSGIIEVI